MRRAHDAPWRSDVQGLRALAVILVVAFHAGFGFSGGFVGVDVFFVISGYVISTRLLSELASGDRVSYRQFYARRARRLLPALAVTVVVTVALGMVWLSPFGPRRATAATGAAASVFVANVQLATAGHGYFDLGLDSNALLHTWSLSVEEQFYFVFPVLVALAWRASRRRRSPTRALGAYLGGGLAASLLLCVWLTARNPTVAFYASPTRAWEFAAGALCAVATPVLARIGRTVAAISSLAGLGAVLAAAWFFGSATTFPGTAALLPVAGAVALIAAGAGAWSPLVTRGLRARSMTWIGDRSYGWYLWHWPAIVFARAVWAPDAAWVLPAVALAALVPTALSYRLLEVPVRRSPVFRGRRLLPLAAVCITVPLLVSALLWSRGDEVSGAAALDAADQIGLHLDATHNCNSGEPDRVMADPSCQWTVPDPKGRVVLAGDSNAGQFTEGLIAATRAEGYDLTVSTDDGCPFADLLLIDHHPQYPEDGPSCRHYVDRMVELLTTTAKPSLVVVGTVADLYVRDTGIEFQGDDGRVATDQAAKTDAWQQGLGSVVHQLSAAGVPVAIVHPVPHFLAWDLRTCAPARMNRGDCGASESQDQVDTDRGGVVAAEEQVAASNAGATTVDLVPDLCHDGVCTTNDGSTWRYRDGVHITVGASEDLAPRFRQLIDDHAVPAGQHMATTPTTATTAPPAATAPRQATPERPLSVVVSGDSVLDNISAALVPAIDDSGEGVVSHTWLLGLTGDAASRLEMSHTVADTHADVVIALLGVWELSRVEHDFDDPDWQQHYERQVLDPFVDLVSAHGAQLVILGMPATADPLITAGLERLNGAYADLADHDPRVTFIDLGERLDHDGAYTEALPGADGQPVRVRQTDGLHLCPAGVALAVQPVLDLLAQRWSLDAPDGWDQGPWRTSDRNGLDPDACPPP